MGCNDPFTTHDSFEDIPDLQGQDIPGVIKSGVLIGDGYNDGYLVNFMPNRDKIKEFKIGAYKRGLFGTLSYYPPILGNDDHYAVFASGSHTEGNIITNESLSIVDENCGEPKIGSALLVPDDTINEELIDIYLSGALDDKIQSFQYHNVGSRKNTYVFPVIMNGTNLGAIEIKASHHIIHCILRENLCLINHVPGNAVDYALKAFDIETLNISQKELITTQIEYVKSKSLTHALERYLSSRKD